MLIVSLYGRKVALFIFIPIGMGSITVEASTKIILESGFDAFISPPNTRSHPMSKFNTIPSQKQSNLAGGVSYCNDAKHELAISVMSSTLSNDFFYESENTRVQSLESLSQQLIADNETEFVAKCAIYARHYANLRSVSHVLGISLCENASGSGYIKPAIKRLSKRVDDMTALVSLWNLKHPESMVPNGMRKAFREVLDEGRFDAYQLKKYEQKRSKVKLKDIIRIARPVKHLELYKQVLDVNLPKIEMLHTSIKPDTDIQETFVELAKAGKVGYMEALKMTPKILESYVSEETLKLWKEIILSKALQSRSGVLPFRYYKAYIDLTQCQNDTVIDVIAQNEREEVKKKYLPLRVYREIRDILEAAFAQATRIEPLASEGEKVAILIDNSGSMSSNSLSLSLFSHALIMAKAIIENVGCSNSYLYFWSDICEEWESESNFTFEQISRHRAANRATYVNMPFQRLIEDAIAVDKVIILTDNQMYAQNTQKETFKTYADIYKRNVAPDVKVLFWDLAGYGAGTPIKLDGDFLEISGLSDKLLSIVPKLWNVPDALVKEIESLEI